MKTIGKNESLIDALTGNLSLISSKINAITIYTENGKVSIELKIELLYEKQHKHILLKLIDVQEYSFFYNEPHIFYYVESYKFFQQGSFFYICFDPENENKEVEVEDQDYILARSVEGFFLV